MVFNVYYRTSPDKNLRCVAAEADSSQEAVAGVTALLKEEGEAYHLPLIAMIVGGLHGV